MPTYYAIFRRPGTGWDPNKSVREQPYWQEHARFADSQFDAGVIILAGPFADGTGSLVVVTAESTESVYEIFRADPWTEHDVLTISDVKEWTIFLDARTR